MEEKSIGRCRGREGFHTWIGAAAAAMALAAGPLGASPAGDAPGSAAPADTLGAALMQWAYDRWTVPWVQVQGPYGVLTAWSYATFQVLACADADLERERLVRHLSAEECEHRMAAFRADQDTSLVFLVHLAAFNVPGARELLRLDPVVRFALEDDRGRRWSPISVKRGAQVPTELDLRLRRVYNPPWVRNGPGERSSGYDIRSAKEGTVVGHVVRFSRRDPTTGDPILAGDLRWLRLRMTEGSNEWVATWPFRTSDQKEVSP